MAFESMKLTNKGIALQAKAQAGKKLSFTQVKFGDGTLSSGETIESLTKIKHEVLSAGISRVEKIDNNRVALHSMLTNQSLTTAFYWREIAVYAQDPDEGEILYCYSNAGNKADYIPGISSNIVEKALEIYVLVGNTESIVVQINESLVFITQHEYTENKEKVEEKLASTAEQLAETDSQLNQLALNVLNYGLIANDTADNTEIFKDVINVATAKGYNTLFFPKAIKAYLVNEDITLPNGLNIVSDGATIITHGHWTLLGKNTFDGITFDGKWDSKGFKAIGDGCNVKKAEFKNFKRNDEGELVVLELRDSRGHKVEDSTFDGIKPVVDDPNEVYKSVSRAIRIYNCKDTLVENNTFKNMDGVADSDYIHVQNKVVDISRYPFSVSPYVTGYFDHCNGVRIKKNIMYHYKAKSDIKIQASGVQVEDNIIYVTKDAVETPSAPIRAYSVIDSNFKNNKLVSDTKFCHRFIAVDTSEDYEIVDNEIILNVEPQNVDSRVFYLDGGENVNVSNNKITGYASGTLFYASGLRNSKITDNKGFIKGSSVNKMSLFDIKNHGSGEKSLNMTVANNIIQAENDNIELYYMQRGGVDDISFINNKIPNGLFKFTLDYVNKLLIDKNNISFNAEAGQYPINLNAGYNVATNLNVKNNTFDPKNYTSGRITLVRSYRKMLDTKITGNDVTLIPEEFGVLYNTNVDYNPLEVHYAHGNLKGTNLDYGYTRNPHRKDIGFAFYDRSIYKMIYWKGEDWIDATGQVV